MILNLKNAKINFIPQINKPPNTACFLPNCKQILQTPVIKVNFFIKKYFIMLREYYEDILAWSLQDLEAIL